MAASVTFNYANFIAAYPEFANCSNAQLSGYFTRAGLFCLNDGTHPVLRVNDGLALLEQFMWLATAHLAWLNAPRDALGNPASTGAQAPSVVGRISSASEGSVSVSTEWSGAGSPSQAWFLQTKYGAELWQAQAQFRQGQYQANPTIVPGTGFPYPYGFGGYWRP